MRFRSGVAVVAFCVSSAAADLPDAPARDKVLKICGTCHEIETVVGSRRTKLGWRQMTEDMVARGAEGSEADLAAVTTYLAEWFGKVNVNASTADEIAKTLGCSDTEASAIVRYRDQNGMYKSFEELLKTPGIDPEKLRAKRSLIAFTQ